MNMVTSVKPSHLPSFFLSFFCCTVTVLFPSFPTSFLLRMCSGGTCCCPVPPQLQCPRASSSLVCQRLWAVLSRGNFTEKSSLH